MAQSVIRERRGKLHTHNSMKTYHFKTHPPLFRMKKHWLCSFPLLSLMSTCEQCHATYVCGFSSGLSYNIRPYGRTHNNKIHGLGRTAATHEADLVQFYHHHHHLNVQYTAPFPNPFLTLLSPVTHQKTQPCLKARWLLWAIIIFQTAISCSVPNFVDNSWQSLHFMRRKGKNTQSGF